MPTVIQVKWAPDYVIQAVGSNVGLPPLNEQEATQGMFKQSIFWLTAQGKWKQISQMSDGHLLNTLLYVERVADDIYRFYHQKVDFTNDEASQFIVDTPLYKALKREVAKRMTECDF